MDIISSTLMETEGLNYAKVEAILFKNLCKITQADICVMYICDPSNLQLRLKKLKPQIQSEIPENTTFTISNLFYQSLISTPVERWNEKHHFYYEILPGKFAKRIQKSPVNWLHLTFTFGGSPIAFALVHITQKINLGLLKSYLHISALILQRSFAFSNLRKTRSELNSVYGSISDIIVLIDKNLKILWTNKLGEYFFGDDLTGKPIYEVLNDGTAQKDDRVLRSLFEEKVSKEFEKTIKNSDGKSKSYQCVASVAGEDSDGQADFCVIIYKDITSQKRQKNNLLLLNDKVNRCQKALIRQRSHNILGKLYSDMYNELSKGIGRTHESLSHLENLLENLHVRSADSQRKDKKDEINKALAELKDSFRFSETLESSFHNLVYIRQISREINPYYLNQSVAELMSLIDPIRSRTIDVKQDFGEIPVIQAMAVEINVAIYEMLNNAVEAVLYPRPVKDGTISVQTWADNEWVYLNIRNNGPLLKAENMLSIFDFFQSSKHHVTGIGVGMTVVNEYVVNRHNGNLSLDTEIEDGASFTLSLPIKA